MFKVTALGVQCCERGCKSKSFGEAKKAGEAKSTQSLHHCLRHMKARHAPKKRAEVTRDIKFLHCRREATEGRRDARPAPAARALSAERTVFHMTVAAPRVASVATDGHDAHAPRDDDDFSNRSDYNDGEAQESDAPSLGR